MIFNSWFKAGDFSFASDEDYEPVLEKVEFFSAFWMNQPSLSVLSMTRYFTLFAFMCDAPCCYDKSSATDAAFNFTQELRNLYMSMCNLREKSRLASKKTVSMDSTLGEEKLPDVTEFLKGSVNEEADLDPIARAVKEGLLDGFKKKKEE